MIFHLASAILR